MNVYTLTTKFYNMKKNKNYSYRSYDTLSSSATSSKNTNYWDEIEKKWKTKKSKT